MNYNALGVRPSISRFHYLVIVMTENKWVFASYQAN
jgi:hypothetical protein